MRKGRRRLTGSTVVTRVEGLARSCLEENGLARRDTLLVVGSSGGPDSQALLYSLVSLQDDLGLRLHVAHLNHNFRGEEAEEDARFVASQAERLSLPSTIEKIDSIAYQREQGISSFEAAAREVRYGFLARVAREKGATAVALGHTADDRAETVLMHILRGTGLHGLRGMEPLSIWHHPRRRDVQATLLRPLLEATRADTEAYCRERDIPFHTDTSNASLRFARNRIRWRLIPALRGYNPRVQQALLRLAHIASQEASYLEQEVERAWSRAARATAPAIALDAAFLASLHPHLQSLLLRRAYVEAAGSPSSLEEAHIRSMMRMLQSPPGKTLHLPQGVQALTGYGELLVGGGEVARCPLPPLEGEHPLNVPGETRLPGWFVHAELLEGAPAELPDGRLEACFDLESVGTKPAVRTRKRGDRFQPLGMTAARKLHDLFVDEKVPRHWRDRVPLVVSEQGIAWVVGYRIAHWARVRKETRSVLRIAFRPEGQAG